MADDKPAAPPDAAPPAVASPPGAPPAAAPPAAPPPGGDDAPDGPPTMLLDGRTVVIEPGELLIEAAERAGVYIPRFCYHPRMKPVGMCRMCLVEVTGPRGPSLQPACFVEAPAGQEVSTDSPAAKKAQEGVLEFLLLNHPLDCPVCDKGGECPLQDQAMSHGPGESRFLEEKRHWAKPTEIGPLILLDRERCIQCARCTRFAEEVAGEPLIDFFARGDAIEVAVFPARPFTSYFAGNTIQICPVGALTSPPYRFKSRPWDLEQVETTCTYCSVGCRVAMQSSAGKMVRFLGIDSEPVNQSWLCDRGRYGYEAVYSKERLTEPLVRREGELVPVAWHEALRDAAAGIRQAISETGPSSVGIIGGARLPNEDAYAWSKLARAVIGTDNLDAQLGDGLPAEVVLGLPRATIAEACSARVLIVLSGDLEEELPVLYLRLRTAAAHENLPIVELSPAATALRSVAAASVVYRPGDAAAVARALVSESFDAASAGLELGAETAERIGAARERLSTLVGSAPNSAGEEDGTGVVVVLGRTSVAESAPVLVDAAATLWRAWPKARFLPALRRANVMGALDLGLAPGMLPGRVSLEAGRALYKSAWAAELPGEAGLGTREMLEAADKGELSALVLLGADPLSDFPDRDLVRRALEKVPFLLSLDTMGNPSVLLADVVLPVVAHGERAGTTTNIEGRVTRLGEKVVAPGTARPDWMIAVEIAERLGADLGFDHLESIWEEIERLSPAHRGCRLGAAEGNGYGDGVVVPIAGEPVRVGRRTRPMPIDPMATPGISSVDEQGAPLSAGAAVPVGERLAEAIETAEPAGPAPPEPAGPTPAEPAGPPSPASGPPDPATDRPPLFSFDPAGRRSPSPPRPDKYALRLAISRSLYDHGTLVQACESLARLAPAQVLRLCPKTVRQLGVSEGDEVRVRSKRAEMVLPVMPDPEVTEGVALLTLNAAPPGDRSAVDLIDAGDPVTEVFVETIG